MKRSKRILGLSVFLALVATASVSSLDMSVAYLEGRVEKQAGSGWAALSLGDPVPTDGVLRLDNDSFVELRGLGLTIKVSRSGTYSIRDLIDGSRRVGLTAVGRALSDAFSALVGGPSRKQAESLGVRGNEETEDNEPVWKAGRFDDHRSAAMDSMKSGDYATAIGILRRALDEATPEERPEAKFLLGYAYAQAGNTAEALRALSGLAPAADDSWSRDFIVLKARLLIDASAYAEEVSWLSGYERSFSDGDDRSALYYFLLGLGYRGLGQAEKARSSLSKASTLAGDEGVGAAAAELLRKP
ncbi:MAG TPA: tetratricopeptide repeat protein [Spirochaetia bacterium]|nr:tetratricopeptide repeat protein [Spirochaetia bacterium]